MGENKPTLEELVKIPKFYFVQPNHAGDKIAFYWDKTGRLQLYTMDLETREITQLTTGEVVPPSLRAGCQWTRDDESLLFTKDHEGDENHNVYRIHLTGEFPVDSAVQLTDTPEAKEFVIETSPDGTYLLMLSTRGEKGQMNLFKLHLETNEVTQLTAFDMPVWTAKWFPDGEHIAFTYNDTDDKNNMDIWMMCSDGKDVKKLLSCKEGSEDTVADISPDCKTLLINSDQSGVARPGLFNIETEEMVWLGEGTYDESGRRFSSDGSSLVTTLNKDAVISPVVYSLPDLKAEPLELPPGIASGANFVLDDSALVVFSETSNWPRSLFQFSLEDNTFEHLITPELGNISPDSLIEAEYVRYESSDGLEIGAILYMPKDIPEGTKVPAIVVVHGGPTGQYYRDFNIRAQVLVNNGYALLLPNFRGSTGYGREFQDMILNDWGGGDLEDVVAGAEFLKQLPGVDPERIGIMGASYGGYTTCIALTKKPDVFKAGLAEMPITDIPLLYEESTPLFRYAVEMYLGKPEENMELWKDRSASNFVHQIKAPIKIIQGVNDPRCPLAQARTFCDKLLEHGKLFEYVEYGDEGHGSADQTTRFKTLNEVLSFFRKYL